jgi:hypothetical protein
MNHFAMHGHMGAAVGMAVIALVVIVLCAMVDRE